MKRLRKLFGYKYKIIWMRTAWRASHFQKTAMIKINIDDPLSIIDFERRLKPTWMWCWDLDSAQVTYTKSRNGLGKLITLDGTNDYYNKEAIKNHFKNL